MDVIVDHNAGFFSCCNIKLDLIVEYINRNKKLPASVDSSTTFTWYKPNHRIREDITFDYFEHYTNLENIEINKDALINYHHTHQYINYSKLDFMNLIPLVKKYFSPSNDIANIINNLEKKYHIDYDNICVLFFRGNDKCKETVLCEYDEYITYAKLISSKNPNIIFLVQSDESGFIKLMTETFPNNSFYFKDEIRHMDKCNTTVDVVMKNTNFWFSKYYLGITIIMSKCKYVICGSGNCSLWIILYRGNSENVYQNLNKEWVQIGL